MNFTCNTIHLCCELSTVLLFDKQNNFSVRIVLLLEQVQVRVSFGNCDKQTTNSSLRSDEAFKNNYHHLNCGWNDLCDEEEEWIPTVKLVSTLFGLIHPGSEFGHLRQNVVQLGCLPLALHYDRKHGQTSQNRSYTRKTKTKIRKDTENTEDASWFKENITLNFWHNLPCLISQNDCMSTYWFLVCLFLYKSVLTNNNGSPPGQTKIHMHELQQVLDQPHWCVVG